MSISVDARKFTKSGVTPNLLVAEMSDLQLRGWPERVSMVINNKMRYFTRGKADMSADDIAGMNYAEEKGGLFKLLIIND